MTAFQSGTIHLKNKTSVVNADTSWTRLYSKTDGSLYIKNDIGTELKLMDDVEVAAISAGLNSKFNLYTLVTDSAALSANLQDIKTSNVTTAAISAGLNTRINTKIDSGNGFAGNWNNVVVNSDGIVTSGAYVNYGGQVDLSPYTLITDSAALSANLQNIKTSNVTTAAISANLQNIKTSNVTTAAISAGLNSKFNLYTLITDSAAISANLQDIKTSNVTTAAISANLQNIKTSNVTTAAISAGLNSKFNLYTLVTDSAALSANLQNIKTSNVTTAAISANLQDIKTSNVTTAAISANLQNIKTSNVTTAAISAGLSTRIGNVETDYVNGSGASTRMAYWTGAKSLSYDNLFTYGTAGQNALVLTRDNTAASLYAITTTLYENTQSFRYTAMSFRRGRGTSASPSAVQDGDYIHGTNYSSYDGTGFNNTAGVYSVVSGTVSAGWSPQKLTFATGNTTADTTTSLSIFPNRDAILVGDFTSQNIKRGTGSPEASIVGNMGDIYQRTRGQESGLYMKFAGNGDNTGWVPVANRTEVAAISAGLNANITSVDADKVNGSGSNNRIAFWSGAKTLSSDSNLEIYTTGTNGIVLARDTVAAGFVPFYATLFENTQNFRYPYMALRRARGTSTSPSAVQDGDYIAGNLFGAYDGTVFNNTAGFGSVISGVVSAGWVPQKMQFSTGYTTAVPVLTLYPNANGTLVGDFNSQNIKRGTVNPQSAITGNIGDIYQRTTGVETALYMKLSGNSSTTGWVPVANTTEVAAISAGLQVKLNTKIDSGNGSAGNWNNVIVNSDGIVTSGSYVDYSGIGGLEAYTLKTESAALSANLQNIKTSNVTTAAISAGLSTRVGSIESNYVTGPGLVNRIPYWSGTQSLTYDANFQYYTGGLNCIYVYRDLTASGINVVTGILYENTQYFRYPAIALKRARGTSASPSAVQNGDYISGALFGAYDGSAFINTAGWSSVITDTPSAGYVPQKFVFAAGNTAAENTPAFTVFPNKNATVVGDFASQNIKRGTVNPQSAIAGNMGDIYQRTTGVEAALYMKLAGNGDTTGWVPVANRTEVAAISAGLNTRINNKIDSGNGFAGTWNNVVVNSDGIVTSGAYVNYSTSSGGTSGANLLLQGIAVCDTSNFNYTITHPTIDLNYSYPTISLSAPTSSSEIYIQAITNRTTTSFDVILSSAPATTGYGIIWHIPTTSEDVSGSTMLVNSSGVANKATIWSSTSTISASNFITETGTGIIIGTDPGGIGLLRIGSDINIASGNGLYFGSILGVEGDGGTTNIWGGNSSGIQLKDFNGNTQVQINTDNKAIFTGSSTSAASINLPHGTAPDSPVDGDLWSTTTGFYGQVNGSTVGPFSDGTGTISGTISSNQLAFGTGTDTISGNSGLTWSSSTGLSSFRTGDDSNQMFGLYAGNGTITGTNNTGLGRNSLFLLETGSNNTALGAYAGDAVGAGVSNTLIGANAGGALNSGNYNVAIGDSALLLSTDGVSNVALGVYAGYSISSGSNNLCIGTNSGANISTSTNNVALGYGALFYTTTASQVGIGFEALRGDTTPANNTGTNNMAIGFQALRINSIGSENTAIGYQAMTQNTSGDRSVAIGLGALVSHISGTDNTAIGWNAGNNTVSGIDNVFIGSGAGDTTDSSASGRFVVGSNVAPITDVFIGNGENNASPQNVIYHTTGGLGTNIAGANLTLAGGIGTGTGTGGNLILQTAKAGTTGSTPNTLTTRLSVLQDGGVDWTGITTANSPAVSVAGHGTIFFDSTLNKFRVSENTGAYTNLVGSGTGGTSGSLLLQGIATCNTSNFSYTITHPTIDINYSYPTISLSAPTSSSDVYVQAITNRTATSFDVILSDTPATTGYGIIWHIPTTSEDVSSSTMLINSTGVVGKVAVWDTTSSIAASSLITDTGSEILIGGKSTFSTSTTSDASINIPHGTAPTTPDNGDLWSTTAGFYGRVNGSTVGPFGSGSYASFTSTTDVPITGSATATLNRMHVLSDPVSGGYTVNISGASAGDVVGFTVANYNSAPKEYLLNVGSGVRIAGRTQYLTLLHTNTAVFKYDGTKWYPLVLNLDTPWVDAGVITVTASTTNPTKGTVSLDKCFWRRVGKDQHIRYQYRQTVSGSSGSGRYYFGIPIGTADSTYLELGSTVADPTDPDYYGSPACGYGHAGENTSNEPLRPMLYTTTTLSFIVSNAVWTHTSNTVFGSTRLQFGIHAFVPMTNW